MKFRSACSLWATGLLLLTLTACGGSSDDGFAYPSKEGAALPFSTLQTLGNADRTAIRNGGFGSAMAPHPTLAGHFYALTDRGPNADPLAGTLPGGKFFPTPGFTPHIGLFKLDDKGQATLVRTVALKDPKGRSITGLPNSAFGSTGEVAYNLDGSKVTLDPDGSGAPGFDESGLDPEGLVALPDGSFWVSDEYGPHMVHFDASGKEIGRINPFAADPRNRAGRMLPPELARRWPNRGMEGLAITPDGKTLVGIMQSNLYNPTSAIGSINLTRIVTVHLETGARAQYLYKQDAAGLANSDIVALSATTFLVIERDTKFFGRDTGTVRKNLYKIDIAKATNVDALTSPLNDASIVRDPAAGLLVGGKTLEQVAKDGGTDNNFAAGWAALAEAGIQPVAKTLVYDAVKEMSYPHDKMEGLWVIDANRVGILNDDDFAIEPDGKGGVRQKVLGNGKVDANTLYVVRLAAPLY
ncbi:esterase-like activity of phytase family protein [Acidovorax sp.]|uniref:esterase-like activity of phytase family protein n=1 Tax=Acidovorax sp. TaxID=1872122 RepID=UPI00391A1618